MTTFTLGLAPESLQGFRAWFDDYLAGFGEGDRDLRVNLEMKRGHTLRVCRETLTLGACLGLEGGPLRLAEALALLHDVGRFRQYARWRTFVDKDSEDHAALGVKILRESGLLRELGEDVRSLILRVISWHNLFLLPASARGEPLFHARLLRDADKLDIWEVLADYYQSPPDRKNRAIEMGLPDTPDISPRVLAALEKGSMVSSRDLRTLSDFKLLQAGWVYGLNFLPALAEVRRRGYLDLLRAQLSPTARTKAVFARIENYLEARLSSYAPA